MILVSFFVISLITIVNSKLVNWGLFLYLPGMFFLSTNLIFNSAKAFIISVLIGLFLDEILETPFGFHGIALPILQLLSKEWINYNGNNNTFRYICFQLISNVLLTIILYSFFKLQNSQTIKWTFSRFSSDLILSTIAFIPICWWFQELVTKIFKIKENKNLITE